MIATATHSIGNGIAQCWRDRADELADFVMRWMVNRPDVWGGYLPQQYREKIGADGKVTVSSTVTKPPKAKRGKITLTRAIIHNHFCGLDVSNVVGLHTTSLENTSKFFAIEIDAHDATDHEAPERNLRAATHWQQQLQGAGHNSLMIDSNGAGGIWVLVILDAPAPTADVYAFVQNVVADFKDHGFNSAPETFPKQSHVEQGKYGNWLRLLGRHHTRNHYSRIRRGDKWLEGNDAIEAFLGYTLSSSKLIPTAPTATETPGETAHNSNKSKPAGRKSTRKVDPDREREIARRCVDAIPNTAATIYEDWVRLGMAIHYVFSGSGEGLSLWHQWSARSSKHVGTECDRCWKDFNSSRAKAATLGTLIHLARQAGVDPFPPMGTDEPGAIENARHGIYASIAQAHSVDDEQRDPSPAIAFDAVRNLATLPAGERAEAIAELKSAIGPALNLNELRREVSREERARRKGRRQKTGDLPEIVSSGRPLRHISDDAMQALHAANDPPSIFTFAGEPARIRSDEHGNARPQIMNEHMVRGRMTRTAEYVAETLDGPMHISPPMDVVRDVMVRADTNFPPLLAVIETPIIRPDGSIFSEPGYDKTTKVFLSPRPDRLPVVPIINPSPEQIREAVQIILEPFEEFPFDVEASHANAIALFFTPALRHHINGAVPLAVADATTPGTGKSLLLDVISIGSIGELPTLISAAGDETEWVKTIISFLSAGATFLKIDNVEGVIRSATLAAAITAIEYTARELGRSKMLTVVQRATWALTGNNVMLGGDLPRRSYHIFLDAHSARPWMGRSFKHPDLLEWVRQNRHRIAAAILTVCRGWFTAGKPPAPADQPIIGGFENWSRTIGGILHFAGIKGFLGNIDRLYESNDETSNEWGTFLAAWLERFGETSITVATIAGNIVRGEANGMREALPCELGKHLSDTTKFSQKLGLSLRRYRGRRFGDDGLFIERMENDSHAKTAAWCIKKDHLAGTAGTCGTFSSPKRVGSVTFSDMRDSTHESTSHERSMCHIGIGQNTPRTSPQSPQIKNDEYETIERLAMAEGGM